VLEKTLITAAALAVLCTAGCQSSRGRLLPAPGPIQNQQQQAVLHDPYTATDIGPEVVGGRPREYANPQPEAARSKHFRESWWGQQ
jgi:hypothetical protein